MLGAWKWYSREETLPGFAEVFGRWQIADRRLLDEYGSAVDWANEEESKRRQGLQDGQQNIARIESRVVLVFERPRRIVERQAKWTQQAEEARVSAVRGFRQRNLSQHPLSDKFPSDLATKVNCDPNPADFLGDLLSGWRAERDRAVAEVRKTLDRVRHENEVHRPKEASVWETVRRKMAEAAGVPAGARPSGGPASGSKSGAGAEDMPATESREERTRKLKAVQ